VSNGGKSSNSDDTDTELLYEEKSVELREFDEYITIRGERLNKPFIEKPINAEDHEIMIYYSGASSAGAGYSVLFRKTENCASQFFKSEGKSCVRKEGSYIYEEFLPTDGFDIKVYTVGD
jgi:inositol hexakisphosphate/diphosphoinositol-pentakisphosphate kinase